MYVYDRIYIRVYIYTDSNHINLIQADCLRVCDPLEGSYVCVLKYVPVCIPVHILIDIHTFHAIYVYR